MRSRSFSRQRDLEQVKKQLLILQRKKKEEEYVFKTEGAKKQAIFVTTMSDWIKDDLRSVLESEYGPLPDRVSSVISSVQLLWSASICSKLRTPTGGGR